MPKRIPPFYKNPDGISCFQCMLRGVLEYFEPETTWSWQELYDFCNKREGLATWPQHAMVNIIERGYELRSMITYDDAAFVKDPEGYLIEFMGEEAAAWSIENSDMENAVAITKKLLSYEGKHEEFLRLPTVEDIKQALDDGYLLHVSLNSRRLNKREGYVGHAILVYAYDEKHFYAQDSGPPEIAERAISYEDMMDAGMCPDRSNVLGFIAYRKRI